jgi:enterochelin esterase-like enzyme
MRSTYLEVAVTERQCVRAGLMFVAVLAVLVYPGDASAQTAVKKGTVEKVSVHGNALVGNLAGESADRDVFVYLPPSYASDRNRRYPVAYLLHGYGLTGERWMTFAKLADAADRAMPAGSVKEMILVNPDSYTKNGGSMYSSSPTSGDWETFMAEDLVKYIDSHYRTIATRESRGLGGHSMGGYGTVRIGMKRPDVFSSLYIMSACCLMNDPGPRAGGPGRAGAGAPAGTPRGGEPGAGQAAARGGEPGATRGAGPGDGRGAAAGAGRGRGGGFGNVQLAEAQAWSANPNNPPDYADMPIKDGEVQPLVRQKWIANSPLAMVDQYYSNLKKYAFIGIEVGTMDGLAASNRQLDGVLTQLGVPHTFETYEGDHTNRVPERIEMNVLPFFSKSLSFAAPRAGARR